MTKRVAVKKERFARSEVHMSNIKLNVDAYLDGIKTLLEAAYEIERLAQLVIEDNE